VKLSEKFLGANQDATLNLYRLPLTALKTIDKCVSTTPEIELLYLRLSLESASHSLSTLISMRENGIFVMSETFYTLREQLHSGNA
jgi:hypothetical protein